MILEYFLDKGVSWKHHLPVRLAGIGLERDKINQTKLIFRGNQLNPGDFPTIFEEQL